MTPLLQFMAEPADYLSIRFSDLQTTVGVEMPIRIGHMGVHARERPALCRGTEPYGIFHPQSAARRRSEFMPGTHLVCRHVRPFDPCPIYRPLLLAVLALALGACLDRPVGAIPVHLHIDGTDRSLATQSNTVRLLLRELDVELAELDTVEPPLWTPIRPGLCITITRIVEERQRRVLTATTRVIRDEFLPPEESQVLAEGRDGLEELVYHVAFDGPDVVERWLVGRLVLSESQERVEIIGTRGTVPPQTITGTIAYVANGDAFVMHGASDRKRRLTEGGGLDGRVFALSPDGRTLLYTMRSAPSEDQLNTLWVADAHVLNTRPRPLGITNVGWAGWRPDGQALAFSSAIRLAGEPGWRALNDLWLAGWPDIVSRELLSPTSEFVYAWWGEDWRWAPDGSRLAYARPDSLGVYELGASDRRPLCRFASFDADGNDIWLPHVDWSPNGTCLAALVPGNSDDRPLVNLLVYDLGTGRARSWARNIGHDVHPVWSHGGKSLACVVSRGGNGEGRHDLCLFAGVDGSQFEQVRRLDFVDLPIVDLYWSPDDTDLLILAQGDLYIVDIEQQKVSPLTASGLVSHAEWR